MNQDKTILDKTLCVITNMETGSIGYLKKIFDEGHI